MGVYIVKPPCTPDPCLCHLLPPPPAHYLLLPPPPLTSVGTAGPCPCHLLPPPPPSPLPAAPPPPPLTWRCSCPFDLLPPCPLPPPSPLSLSQVLQQLSLSLDLASWCCTSRDGRVLDDSSLLKGLGLGPGSLLLMCPT